jgi:hypothetical protein
MMISASSSVPSTKPLSIRAKTRTFETLSKSDTLVIPGPGRMANFVSCFAPWEAVAETATLVRAGVAHPLQARARAQVTRKVFTGLGERSGPGWRCVGDSGVRNVRSATVDKPERSFFRIPKCV